MEKSNALIKGISFFLVLPEQLEFCVPFVCITVNSCPVDTSPQQVPQQLQAEFDLVTNTNHSKYKLLQVLWTLSVRDMKWGSQVSVTMESPVQLSEILTESSIW